MLEGGVNACHAFFGRNVWPDEDKHESGVIGLRPSLLRYQNALLKLAEHLQRVSIVMMMVPLDYHWITS